MDTVTTILFVVIGFSFLILIHEFGHYMAARLVWVQADEFGLGLPPKLLGKKIGKTLYTLNLLPIGGFVKLKGQSDFDPKADIQIAKDPDSYLSKNAWQRLFIIVAGVLMNAITAVILLMVAYMLGVTPMPGNSHYDAMLAQSDKQLMIGEVLEDSPAQSHDLEAGDAIVSVNGQQITSLDIFQELTQNKESYQMTILDNETKETRMINSQVGEDGKFGIAIGMGAQLNPVQLGFIDAVKTAIEDCGIIISRSVDGLQMLVRSLSNSLSIPDNLAGPVGIVSLTSDAAQNGITEWLKFLALISLSLAFINILPLPALDGGRAFFLLIEGVLGRSLSARFENYIHAAGMMLLLAFMFAITYQDILRLIS